MSFFPILFTGILAGAHLYLFWCLHRALPPGFLAARAVAGVVIAAGLLAFLSRWRFRPLGPAVETWIFLWIAFVLVAVMLLLLVDCLHLAVLALDRLGGWNVSRLLGDRRGVRIGFLLALLGFGYALYEARAVGVTRLEVTTAKLPPERSRLRIVAVSDIHLTRRDGGDRLDRLARLIEARKPDMVALLGDVVDDRLLLERRDLVERLRRIDAPLGKFAVLGNHELYSGGGQAEQFLQDAGFRVLRGESVESGGIAVAGVDDPVFRSGKGIMETVAAAAPGLFVLLLAHRPVTPEEAIGRFDLQLSGHTHGGQLLPGRFFTRLAFGRRQGLNRLVAGDGGGESLLFLTNGAGYWGPPVRFLAPPEIVVVDVVREEDRPAGAGAARE